jgi:hypothetical protein
MNTTALELEQEENRLNKKWTVWIGRLVSALPVFMLLGSAMMKLTHQPALVGVLTHLGYPEAALPALGIIELVSVVLYAIPATSVLGATAITAFMGGAVASHVRVGDPFIAPVVIGLLAWGGLLLRDRRLRKLLPLRSL